MYCFERIICYTTKVSMQAINPGNFGSAVLGDCNIYWNNNLGNLSQYLTNLMHKILICTVNKTSKKDLRNVSPSPLTVAPLVYLIPIINATCYMGKEWRQHLILMLMRMCLLVYTFMCIRVIWIIQVSDRLRGDFSINSHLATQTCRFCSEVTTLRLLRLKYWFSYNRKLFVNPTFTLTFTIIHSLKIKAI